jgi:hypothetical protein
VGFGERKKMEDKPNYYSVIPAIVRYDNELKPNEKLLYGEISALTNRNGECWASNDYFAKLYDKSKDTVSDWISMLNKKGYISVELIRNETTKAIEKRIIRINHLLANIDLVPVKSPIGYRQKSLEGIGKKTEENNTSINNTSINIKEINKERFELFWKEYPRKVNKFKTEEWFNKNSLTDEQFDLIITKLKKYKDTTDWKKDNGKYIPYPTTWLNQKRWEDDVISISESNNPNNIVKYSDEWWKKLGSDSGD